MKKRLISCIMLGILLTGCGKTATTTEVIGDDKTEPVAIEEVKDTDTKEEEVHEETPVVTVKEVKEYEMSEDFNTNLMNYIEAKGYETENYMISPTSYRAAVVLAVVGADGETRETLRKGLGFEDDAAMEEWYKGLRELEGYFLNHKENVQHDYKEYMPEEECTADNWEFSVLNSVWNNSDLTGHFTDKYLKEVENTYKAAAYEKGAGEITDAINGWVDTNTKGMIPKLLDDASESNAVLVNTVYLKTAFRDEFYKDATEEKDFNAIDGSTTKKDFMKKQDRMVYYEDDKMKLIELPMEGGISLVVALGESTPESVMNGLRDSEYCQVNVELPKIDLETSFAQKELVDYFIDNNAGLAFSDDADFSIMCEDEDYKISDIIQKTKIKLDEEGVEASAATAVLMTMEAAMWQEPEEPKQFIANEPFKYYILADDYDGHGEIMFFGQIVK